MTSESRTRSKPEARRRRFPRADTRTADLTVVDLLARILRHTPPLPGALCVDQPDLFDEHEGAAASAEAEAAVAICRSCPELQACARWYSSLPWTHKPGGTVAARYRSSPTRRRNQHNKKEEVSHDR